MASRPRPACAKMRAISPSNGVACRLDLTYATGVGSTLGFFQQTSSGGLGGVDPAPGSTLNFQIPVLDTTTGTISYIAQVQTLVVPAGGVSALTIFEAALPSGSYDFDIFAQDYSENTSLDTVTLTVP